MAVPETIYSANRTPAANGLKDWTPADVVQALQKGLDKDNKPLCPPMPFGSGDMGAAGAGGSTN